MTLDTLNMDDLEAFRALLLERLNMPGMMLYKSAICKIDLNPKMRTTAGRVNYRLNKMYLNVRLLTRNPHHIEQTFAHELAHIVAFELYGIKAVGHGPLWSGIMQKFGYEPNRCHALDVSGLKRRQKTYETYCQCRVHMLKPGRYNKLRRGVNFRCMICKSVLMLTKGYTNE